MQLLFPLLRKPKSPSPKTLLTPVKDLSKGTLFAGRYEIIKELGKGSMGKVYKALDNEIHEEVRLFN